MKVAKALAGTAATGLLVVGLTGTASAASQAPAGATACSTSKVSSTTAQGWCGGGTTWRLGIRCTTGAYQWTTWYTYSTTTRLTCAGGTLTHYWIDTK
ncbi:hypothetical protein [Streptomyces sp. CoH17]|uniref:hypothetical protein n=1 Tax=Streptomyces sp. CoH17 TaxID=2992806 RepID=UPI002271404E|nr:hypothetical protein [Streptomyces sp. CoH17]